MTPGDSLSGTPSSANTENSPLLPVTHEAVHNQFSDSKKRVVLSLVAGCGLMPFLVVGTLIPSIPQIAEDLGTTASVISLTVSLSMVGLCVGGLCAAAYSSSYGRRPVYLAMLVLCSVASIGVARSNNAVQLMASRFMQAFGASPGIPIGTAVIGDLYQLEQCGTALGVFFAVLLLGHALASPLGGFVAGYASWRVMQLVLGVICGIIFVLIFLLLPETGQIDSTPRRGGSKFFTINPLKPLLLMRSPNLLAISFAGFIALFADNVLHIPLAYTLGTRYNITDPALIGACFLPSGIGNLIGSILSGKMSDSSVVQWRDRRKGVWYPEDRLRVALPATLFVVPLAVLIFGICTEYVPGPAGLVVTLLCLFMKGLGREFVLGPTTTYIVDLMREQSAGGIAAIGALRSLILSLSIAGIFPLINTLGLIRTNTLTACIACLGYLTLLCTVKYGAEMRAVVDVGFSDSRTRSN